MRLRLRVERNELPAVTTIWPVADSEIKHTIAQLLEKVNSRFPLESEHWGLESYKVCVGGYECLHYHEIGAVCKDEDEVVVRPLQTAEVRARTLLGRDQITMDGRHLVDGVPFGRPLLREPHRSQVRIPPPKRRKLEHRVSFDLDDGEAGDEEEEDSGMLDEGQPGLDLESDDDEDDESFRDDEDDDERDLSDNDDESDQDGASVDSDDDSVSDSSSEVSSTSEEDSDDTSSDSDAPPWDGITSPTKPAHGGNAQNKHQEQGSKLVPPGDGETKTKERNRRRKRHNRLIWLKTHGELPPDADLAALDAYEARDTTAGREVWAHSSVMAQGSKKDELERKRHELLSQLASGGIDVTDRRCRGEEDGAPEEISTKNKSTASPNVEAEPASTRRNRLDVAGTKRLLFGSLGVRVPKSQQDKDALQKKLAGRAGRNETGAAGSARVFESHRAEATTAAGAEDEDPDAWREKIDLRAVECVDEGVSFSTPPFPFHQRWDPQQRKKKNRSSSTHMAGNKRRKTGGEDGDFVETYDKYNQHGGSDALNYDDDEEYWEEGALMGDAEEKDEDPASQQLLSEAQNGIAQDAVAEGRRVRFQRALSSRDFAYLVKNLLSYAVEKSSTMHDDDRPGTIDHIIVDFATAIEARRAISCFGGEYVGEVLPGAQDDADFPLPPQTLPKTTITAEQAKAFDFLVYQELIVSAATNWQPSFVLRTVRLTKWDEDQQAWRVARPLRDQPAVEYDEEGKRIYSKFEMEGYDDDSESSDLMTWEQLADGEGLGHVLRDWE